MVTVTPWLLQTTTEEIITTRRLYQVAIIFQVGELFTWYEEKSDNADKSTEVQKLNLKKFNMHTSRSSEIELQEVQDLEHQKFTMQTSRGSESELAEVHKADPIYTNYNQTNQSYIDMSYTVIPHFIWS